MCFVRKTLGSHAPWRFKIQLKKKKNCLWILSIQTPVCRYGSLVWLIVNLINVSWWLLQLIQNSVQNETLHLMYWKYSDALPYLFDLLCSIKIPYNIQSFLYTVRRNALGLCIQNTKILFNSFRPEGVSANRSCKIYKYIKNKVLVYHGNNM